MVSDAFRDAFPTSVDFEGGEQPASTKLEGWAEQMDTGFALMSKAVGDVWGDNFSTNVLFRHEDRPTNIASLARLIGPASMINPVTPGRDQSFTVTYDSSEIPADVNEFQLPFAPLKITEASEFGILYSVDTGTGAGTIDNALSGTDVDGAANVFTTHVASKQLVNGTGDYFVDNHGMVYTYDRLTGGNTGNVTYTAYVAPDSYDKARFNVIPDWTEATTLCTITDLGGGSFQIDTPTIDAFPRYDGSGAALGVDDPESVPTSYQPKLPYGLVENFTGLTIPDGFVQIWDTTADAIVDGLTLTLVSATRITTTGATLTVAANRYRIVTVGTTITEMLNHLRSLQLNHRHDGFGVNSSVSHSDLIDLTITGDDVFAEWAIDVNSPPSIIDGNDHPQYLTRYGWITSLDPGQSDNAMLGDLFMAVDQADYTTSYEGAIGDDSRVIVFGNSTNGPTLYYDGSTNATYSYGSLRVTGHASWGNFSVDNHIYTGDRTGDYTRVTADRMQFFQAGSAVHDADIQQEASKFNISTSGTMDMQIWSSGGLVQFVTDTWTGGGHTVALSASTGDFDITATTAGIDVLAATTLDLVTTAGDITITAGGATSDMDIDSGRDILIDADRYITATAYELMSVISTNAEVLIKSAAHDIQLDAGRAVDASYALHMIIPYGAAAPTSGIVEGSLYWHTGSNVLQVYNGATWETVTTSGP